MGSTKHKRGIKRRLIGILATLLMGFSPTPHAGLLAYALHGVEDHPIVSTVGVGLAAGAYELYEHHCHEVEPARPGVPALWACEGVRGDHPWVQETKDLYLERSNTAKLERSLEAAGESRHKGCAAHHIVPQNEKRSWAKDYVDEARSVLKKCDININSAENGVWLPNKPGAECQGEWHPSLHTKAYYKSVARKLRKNLKKYGCEGVKKALSDIKKTLSRG